MFCKRQVYSAFQLYLQTKLQILMQFIKETKLKKDYFWNPNSMRGFRWWQSSIHSSSSIILWKSHLNGKNFIKWLLPWNFVWFWYPTTATLNAHKKVDWFCEPCEIHELPLKFFELELNECLALEKFTIAKVPCVILQFVQNLDVQCEYIFISWKFDVKLSPLLFLFCKHQINSVFQLHLQTKSP